MGTNYYAARIPTVAEHEKMQQALNEFRYDDLQSLVSSTFQKIHIGKQSCGWQFCFQYQPYMKSLSEPVLGNIKEFFSSGNVYIEDEYGKRFTPNEFWQKIKECLYHDSKHKNYTDCKYEYSTFNDYITPDGIWVSKTDFE